VEFLSFAAAVFVKQTYETIPGKRKDSSSFQLIFRPAKITEKPVYLSIVEKDASAILIINGKSCRLFSYGDVSKWRTDSIEGRLSGMK
jgi:hypothetical protein